MHSVVRAMVDKVRINYAEGMKVLSNDENKPDHGLQGKKKNIDELEIASQSEDLDLSANVGTEHQDLSGPADDTFIDTTNFQ